MPSKRLTPATGEQGSSAVVEERPGPSANDESEDKTEGDCSPELPLLPWLGPLARAFVEDREGVLWSPLRRTLRPEPPKTELGASTGTGRGSVERAGLAAALGQWNSAVGNPRAADLAARLAEPASRVVVTGQQPGFLGGPMYTLTKALAVTLWAEHLSSLGRPTTPVFWIATEDHDWSEVSVARFPRSGADPWLRLGPDTRPCVPLAERLVGTAPVIAIRELARGANPWVRSALEQFVECYQPELPWGVAFARVMVVLLGDRCPLLLPADLPALKAIEAPLMARLIERQAPALAALEARAAAIEGAGFSLQVPVQRGALPLFLHVNGRRRRVVVQGDRWCCRGDGTEGSVQKLADLARERPQELSPSALLRPVLQDAALGTDLFVLGPGELAYMAQAAPLYEVLGVQPPAVALRPHTLVLDARGQRQVASLAAEGVGLAEVLGCPGVLAARLAQQAGIAALSPREHELVNALEELTAQALSLDANLERAAAKASREVRGAVERLRRRVERVLCRRDEERHARIESLRAACLPEGKLQERLDCAAYFFATHGPALLTELSKALLPAGGAEMLSGNTLRLLDVPSPGMS